MDIQVIEKARALFEKAPYIARIQDQSDYEKALALMDELIEDYDCNRALIVRGIRDTPKFSPPLAAQDMCKC